MNFTSSENPHNLTQAFFSCHSFISHHCFFSCQYLSSCHHFFSQCRFFSHHHNHRHHLEVAAAQHGSLLPLPPALSWNQPQLVNKVTPPLWKTISSKPSCLFLSHYCPFSATTAFFSQCCLMPDITTTTCQSSCHHQLYTHNFWARYFWSPPPTIPFCKALVFKLTISKKD
jgi:hypothetical protein